MYAKVFHLHLILVVPVTYLKTVYSGLRLLSNSTGHVVWLLDHLQFLVNYELQHLTLGQNNNTIGK